jgi:hypothetical protein
MSEELHSLAVKWEFTTEANIEQLIEELGGVLETYAGLVGCSGAPDELARLLELAQDGKREVASAIENLSPLAQSLLNYPTPLPPLWKMSSARLSDEIISRLLKSVRLAQHLDRAKVRARRIQSRRFGRPAGRPRNGPEAYLTACLAVIYQKYAGKKPTNQFSVGAYDGYEPTQAQNFMNDVMKLAGIRGENPSFRLLRRHFQTKREINKHL